MPVEDAVAIVGMACRYPGARDVGEYWAMLRDGTDGISRFGRDELIARGVDADHARRADFVPAKGMLTGSRDFDWTFFGYSRAEAAGIDPQQRVFLECVSAAIDDAALDPARFPGWIGVYAGADVVTKRAIDGQGEMAGVIGREKDFLATRVAYKLGLRGPAITVQTACSTSLTATHMAVRSLLGYECDAAVAGGVALIADDEWGYLYEPGGILSPDGYCRPFDVRAGGTVPSEGVGVVVLKRLADALREGDRITAVILGSAVNNDGADKIGYTAPSIPGQSEVIRYAHQVAGTDPVDVDYVEAHGTATRMGDPVEVQALTDVFTADAVGWCGLGAVKGNLGHTGAAAGVAGLIKTALMLEHRELVPTPHFGAPNPLLELDSTPFRVCAGREAWPDRGTPLAAVSSFGVGGTNAHVVLRAAPAREKAARQGPRLVALSAASPRALTELRRAVTGHVSTSVATLPEVARTLAERRCHSHRTAVVATTLDDAVRELRAAPDAEPTLGRVAFLFPGQGLLRDAAGAVPHRLLESFRDRFDALAAAVRTRHEVDLSPVVEPGAGPEWFEDTVHQQLGLFALGYGLAATLVDWGVRPSAMFGNSVGEYAAAAVSGVWSPEDAASVVYQRAAAMRRAEPGVMVSLGAAAEDVADRVGSTEVSIAVAGPQATVLSGPEAAMERLLAGELLAGLDVRRLSTRHAFHSPAMAQAADAVRDAVAAISCDKPRIPLVSNETGDWADPEAVVDPAYWANQMVRCVRLAEGAGTLLASGCDTVIELGPGTSMLGTLRRHPSWSPSTATIPMLGRAGQDAEQHLLIAVGSLWERGANPDLPRLLADDAPRCSLPPHPFAATSPDQPAPPPVLAAPPAPPAAVVSVPAAVPVHEVLAELWRTTLGVSSVAENDDFFVLGGESLMVVNLLASVRDRLGVEVSVTEFSAAPTFGTLLRLAQPSGPRSWPPGVVPLTESGTGTPLFLVADAMGTTMGYRALAELLERPVYGLEPGESATGITELAATYADTVLAVAPQGPFTVGGWSFGAFVAHELAHQLLRRGAPVDSLICLDGYPPAPGRPVGTDPGYLVGTALAQAGAVLGVGPVGRRLRTSPRLRARFVANTRAVLRYQPPPVGCPALVIKAGAADARLRARLRRSYPGGVSVHPVPGDHWSMLANPQVLARLLREARFAETTVHTGDDHGN